MTDGQTTAPTPGAYGTGRLPGGEARHDDPAPCQVSRAAAASGGGAPAAHSLTSLLLWRSWQQDSFSNARTPGRADEISSASGMAELSLLTSEALAYVHALSGDFSKEARYRAQCAQASSALRANSPGPEIDLTLFDCLHK